MSSNPTTSLNPSSLLHEDRSRLVIVDLQTAFIPHIDSVEAVLANVDILLRAATLCGVPIDVTEQCPQKLGQTVDTLPLPDRPSLPKDEFSAVPVLIHSWEKLAMEPESTARPQIVICGIESHICVLQTAFELRDQGFQPYVVADACRSRQPHSHQTALDRLQQAGIAVVTTEMVLFEWARTSTHPEFRTLSKLIR